MTGKKRTLLSAAGVLVAGLTGAALLAIGQWAYLRLDLSSGRIYSVSRATKDILGRLEDPVIVKAYFSDELPPQYAFIGGYTMDLLKEYQRYSGGNLKVEFVDMSDPETQKEAMRLGVSPVQFNIIQRHRQEVREGFMGLVLLHLDKSEVVPVVQKADALEYDITSRIRRLVDPTRKKLAFLLADGALGPGDIAPPAAGVLRENYEVVEIDLGRLAAGEIPWPADVAGAFLLGPREELDAKRVYVLDRLAAAGVPLVLGLDPLDVNLQTFQAHKVKSGLDDWLAHHGVVVRKEAAFDLQNQAIQIQRPQGWMVVRTIMQYPPFIVARGLDDQDPVVKDLDNLVMPFAAPVEMRESDLEFSPLVRSSQRSWIQPPQFPGAPQGLSPFQELSPAEGAEPGPFTLAMSAKGTFKPYYDKAPEGVALTGLPTENKPGRVVVLGTSRFIHQGFNMPKNNIDFFLNLADMMAQDPALIAIRSKAVEYRTLDEVSDAAKTLVQILSLFTGPLLLIAGGFWAWGRRKKDAAARAALYS